MRSAPEVVNAQTPDDMRLPPLDKDAELIVLGCCLRSESKWMKRSSSTPF